MKRKSVVSPWADDLRAANRAFATLEQQLRDEIAQARQDREQATAQAEQHLARAQDLELRLQAALAEQPKLEADLAQASRQLAASGQARIEAETLAEQARREHALLQADVQRLNQALADQGTEHAVSIARLRKAAALAAETSAADARQARSESVSRVAQLKLALEASQAERERIQQQLQDATQRFHTDLVGLSGAMDAQMASMKEAEQAHRQHALQTAQALAERDQHQASLASRLVTATDSMAELHSRWSAAVQAANDSATAHAAQVLKLQESVDRERQQLLERLAQADLRAQTQTQAEQAASLARQAALSATHALQQAALLSQVQTLRDELDQRVPMLESRLQEADRRFEALQGDALATGLALTATQADHEAALQAMALAHAAQRQKWLREQAGTQAAIVESLQRKFELDARAQDTLRAEILAMQDLLLAATNRQPDPAPPPNWIDIDAIQSELQTLRQALAVEQQRCQDLATLLAAPAPEAVTQNVSPMIAQAQSTVPEPLSSSLAIALPLPELADRTRPSARHDLQQQHELAPMNTDRSLDELLALYDEEFVNAAYLTYLQRPADPAGFQIHVNKLRGGLSKESMLLAFAISAEAQQCHGTHPHTNILRERATIRRGNLVARSFRRLLGLNPSTVFSRIDAVENRLGKAMNELALTVRKGDGRFGDVRAALDGLAHALTAEQQRQTQQHQALSGQFAEAVAQLAVRVSLIDQRIEELQAAVSLAAQTSAQMAAQTAESMLSQIQQSQALTREEARLTRAVASNPWPATDVHGPAGAAGNGVSDSPVDRLALARVREMLLAREVAS